MHIPPPPHPDRFEKLTVQGRPRRRLLRPMVIGSVALHVLLLLALWLLRPQQEGQEGPASDQVAMVFENQAGTQQPSTEAATPSPSPSVAAGNPDAPVAPPTPDTSMASLAPPPSPAPPVLPPAPQPPPPTPPVTAPPVPQPPSPAPPVATSSPPVPQPVPTPNRTPPTVSLNEEEGPSLQPLPPFVPPVPPLPLPPLPPRAAPPRMAARPATPRSTSPFASPRDWSFNAGPQAEKPGRASRGFDLSAATQGSQRDSELGFVSGARPTGDWVGALRRWTSARIYYPEEAIVEHQQGSATVLLDIDRSGRVLSVKLLSSARSAFLDGAWIDIFRNSVVPPFTPDMTGQDTQITYTLHYILVSH